MSPSVVFWLAVAGVILFMMSVDSNVAKFVDLLSQAVVVEVRRRYLMLIMHPRNPITNWIQARKMAKLARDLRAELNLPDDE